MTTSSAIMPSCSGQRKWLFGWRKHQSQFCSVVRPEQARRCSLRPSTRPVPDLLAEVQKGTFREDFYYRLSTFVIKLPPLRERKDDLIMLAQFFIDKFCRKYSAAASNNRAAIITDKGVRASAERVKERLAQAGFEAEIWDDVVPEAPVENILKGAEAVNAHQPSIIVAVGGGSAIDSAKMIWLLYEKP